MRMVTHGKSDEGKEVSRYGSLHYESTVGPKREERVWKPG
jgi:hypothetical protein